eukprot:1158974-Pelagomonas_calceolata.AAC.1
MSLSQKSMWSVDHLTLKLMAHGSASHAHGRAACSWCLVARCMLLAYGSMLRGCVVVAWQRLPQMVHRDVFTLPACASAASIHVMAHAVPLSSTVWCLPYGSCSASLINHAVPLSSATQYLPHVPQLQVENMAHLARVRLSCKLHSFQNGGMVEEPAAADIHTPDDSPPILLEYTGALQVTSVCMCVCFRARVCARVSKQGKDGAQNGCLAQLLSFFSQTSVGESTMLPAPPYL